MLLQTQIHTLLLPKLRLTVEKETIFLYKDEVWIKTQTNLALESSGQVVVLSAYCALPMILETPTALFISFK